MIMLSLCTGVPVIAKGDGRLVGHIKNVYFDRSRRVFAYFGIARVGGDALFLPVSAAIPRHAMLLDESTLALLRSDVDTSSYIPDLLSLAAYTLGGERRGVVADAKFTPDGVLCKLVLSDGEISPSQIACVGDVLLVKSRPVRRVPRPKTDYPVHILRSDAPARNGKAPSKATHPDSSDARYRAKDPDIENSDLGETRDGESAPDARDSHLDAEISAVGDSKLGAETLSSARDMRETGPNCPEHAPSADVAVFAYAAPPPPAIAAGKGEPMFSAGALSVLLDDAAFVQSRDAHNPTRIICDYDFLLGRTLGADLVTYMGETLAPKGAIITPSIVELARAHGKLVDLTLNSVKRTR